jgi:CubicO group peptidase (beta-lactamase class C family)
LADIHALIEREFVPARSPSVVLAVARREGQASIRGFGLAQWDPAEVPPTPEAIYSLTSLTKPFVALAAVQQPERGALGLHDPVVRHIPEFGDGVTSPGFDRRAVTVYHLLTHTAGMDWQWENERWHADPDIPRRWETLAANACRAPLLFAPGTMFHYSGTNYIVLAEVARRCSGLRIDAYLRGRVFAPLGMADTGFFPYDDPALRTHVAQVANSGWPEDRTARNTTNRYYPPETRVPNPGGGLRSSGRDLVTFGRACLQLLRGESPRGAPISSQWLRAMIENRTEGLPAYDTRKGAAATPKGLGWDLPGLEPKGRAAWSPSAFGHGGSSGVVYRVDPERDLIVAVLGSRSSGMKGKGELADAAAQAVP